MNRLNSQVDDRSTYSGESSPSFPPFFLSSLPFFFGGIQPANLSAGSANYAESSDTPLLAACRLMNVVLHRVSHERCVLREM